jgi:hypothetical protein
MSYDFVYWELKDMESQRETKNFINTHIMVTGSDVDWKHFWEDVIVVSEWFKKFKETHHTLPLGNLCVIYTGDNNLLRFGYLGNECFLIHNLRSWMVRPTPQSNRSKMTLELDRKTNVNVNSVDLLIFWTASPSRREELLALGRHYSV